MYIARMVAPASISLQTGTLQQATLMHSYFSDDQINSMVFWVEHQKSSSTSTTQRRIHIDVSLSNIEQRLAYEIVASHFHSGSPEPLSLIITGQGSGKSFVINGLRQLLGEKCVVSCFFWYCFL